MLGSIQISGSHLSDSQVKDICSSVSNHKVPLLTLRKCKTKDKNFKALATAVSRSKALLQLNLNLGLVSSRVRILSLADALHVNRSLTTLLLYGSKLGDKGTIVLCEALVQHPQIVTLDIGNCDLTDLSIPYIVQLLPNNGAKPGLHELTLSANKEVTPTGWTQFAMAMAAGCHLQSLYVDYNPLGDHSINSLAVAVATTKSLRFLDFEACDITNAGAQMLLHLLETHENNVQKLVLRGNTISRSLLKNIQELLYQKTQYCKSDQERDSCSSSKDSSESEGDYELHENEENPGRETEDDQDEAKSSTTALHNFTTERVKMSKKDQMEPEANDTHKGVKSHQRPHSHNASDSGELGSDENDSIDEEDKNGLSEEGSHLKTMADYFSRDQTVYSNLYIQAQQRDDENPQSHDKVKTINDAMFSRVMRVSKDGYG